MERTPETPPPTEAVTNVANEQEQQNSILDTAQQVALKGLVAFTKWRIDVLGAGLDHIDQAELQRLGSFKEVTKALGERKVTDAHSPERGARPRESTTAGLTAVPIIKHLSDKHSPHLENNADNETQNERDFEYRPSIITIVREQLSARRILRQERRQIRSRGTESRYWTSLGRGRPAGIATRINRIKRWRRTNQRYLNGEITAKERRNMLLGRTNLTSEEKQRLDRGPRRRLLKDEDLEYTATGAVRREVRRERAGGLHAIMRTAQPISRRFRAWQRPRVEKKIEKNEQRLEILEGMLGEDESLSPPNDSPDNNNGNGLAPTPSPETPSPSTPGYLEPTPEEPDDQNSEPNPPLTSSEPNGGQHRPEPGGKNRHEENKDDQEADGQINDLIKGALGALGKDSWAIMKIMARITTKVSYEAGKISADEVWQRHKSGQPVSLEETLSVLSMMRYNIGAEALSKALAKDKITDEHAFISNSLALVGKTLEKGRDGVRSAEDIANEDNQLGEVINLDDHR